MQENPEFQAHNSARNGEFLNKSMPNFGGHWLISPSDADAGLMVYVPGGSFAG